MEHNNTEVLREVVTSFLNTHRKAVFAILDAQGAPTTSLMLYAIDDNFNVYFGTCRSFGKYADILRSPIVSLSVVEEKVDPLRVIDMRGIVAEIPDAERDSVHSFFKTKNPSKYYIENAPDFVMFKITPTFIRFADSTSGELVITDLSPELILQTK